MKRRALLAGLATVVLAEGCTSQPSDSGQPSQAQTSRPADTQPNYTRQITLPKPTRAGTVSLEEAIDGRRSVRTFDSATVPVGAIGQLFWR